MKYISINQIWCNVETDLFMNLFEKLQFFLESLTFVFGIDMKQSFSVQVLTVSETQSTYYY